MKHYVVLYATREGQTRKIAEHVAAHIRSHGNLTDMIDVGNLPPGFKLDEYGGAVLTASIHCGRHEPEMVRFVKENVPALERIDAGFLSVSLSEAGAEDISAPAAARASSAADAQRMIDDFLAETGWRPAHTAPVAGALMYTHYSFLTRFVMKRIARKAGASTDTSRDHEFTDWRGLDRMIDGQIPCAPAAGKQG